MNPRNNNVDFTELNQYTCRLRLKLIGVEDGYASYGEFNALSTRWIDLRQRHIFHNSRRGIQPPYGLRRFSSIVIAANEEYSFLDQFKKSDVPGVFAMQADGEVVPVPDEEIVRAPCEWDIAYSGMSQAGRVVGKMNQHMMNMCDWGGVFLVVMSNRNKGECRVMGFYEGVGWTSTGPGNHPHKFFLRRI